MWGDDTIVNLARPRISAWLAIAVVLASLGTAMAPAPARPIAAATRLTPEQQQLLAITRQAPEPATDAEQARAINASLPASAAPILAARPFRVSLAADRALAVECLAQAVYYEAGFEPLEGRRAVAQVVLNRLRHPAFPKTVCGVVYDGAEHAGCQFSFACDGSMRRPPAAGAWKQAHAIAQAALDGYVMKGVGEATHYHTDYVAPYWAPKLTKIRQIGAHIFYRWPGGWGEPGAFNGRYAGSERAFAPARAEAPALVVAAAETPKPPVRIADPTDHHAEADVGGRIDVAKGWTLSIPLPTETRSSLTAIAEAQGG
jgi:spore germination cell wall hydrolase CwlJ-like protein